MVHERLGDFLRLGFWGGEAKISLGPQIAAHQGEGVAEGRLSLGVPGGGADGTGAIPEQALREQGDEGNRRPVG